MHTVPKLKATPRRRWTKPSRNCAPPSSEEAKAVKSEAEWKTFRDRSIGRKSGVLTQINDLWLKAAPKDSKREVGQRVNEIRTLVEDIVSKAENIQSQVSTGSSARSSTDCLDITLPGIRRRSAPNIP